MTVQSGISQDTKNERIKLFEIVAKNWALIFLILLIIIFSFTGRGFLSLANFQIIVHLSTILLLLATSETFVIITGGIDLSVGMVMGLTAAVSSKIMQIMNAVPYPEPVSMLVGSLIGIAVSLIPGLISGLLIARYRVPPFIATLGMWGISNGIALKIAQGSPITHLPRRLVELGNGYIIQIHPGKAVSFFKRPPGIGYEQVKDLVRIIPNSFVYVFVILLIAGHLLKKTKFGQHTYAIGGSMDAATRAGIDVKRHLIKTYVLSTFLAGLAGAFDVFQTGIGNFTRFAAMYELFAIASVIIGGASLMGGKGSLGGSIIGVLLLGVLENGLLISGVEPFYRFITVGLILIVAVVIDKLFPELF